MSKYSVGDFEVGDRIIASGNRLGVVSNITKKITITWENGLSAEYTPKQMQAWNYKKFLEDEGGIAPCQDSHNLTSAQELAQDSLQRKGDNCHTRKDDKHHKIELCQHTEDQKLQKNTGNCINKDLAVKMSVKPSESEETPCGKSLKITATTLEQKNCFHLLNLKENDTPQTMKGITDVQNAIATSSYIESSGNYKMELSQTVITSTIKTETNQTIGLKTLNVLPLQNTEKFTDSQKDTSLSLDSYHTTQKPSEDLTQEKFILQEDRQQQQLEEVNEQSGKQSITKPNQQELTGSTQIKCLQQSTYVQELGPASPLPHSCLEDSSLKDSVNPMNGVSQFSNADFQVSKSIQMLKDSPGKKLENNSDRSTVFLPPLPAPHSPQKANGLEVQTSVIASPQSSKPLENYSPNLQPLKMSQDSLPALITQDNQQAHISEAWSEPLTFSGTMRNGLLSEAAILPAPTLESEYCWLRSPGALSSTGKGRPPGQTKQEAELKRLGLLNSCEVLNPVILCQWYEIPETWLDPLESRAATELLEECGRQQEIFSILESQESPYNESFTSTPCVENQPPLTRANAKAGTYIIDQSQSLGIIKDNLGFGFVVDWPNSGQITYNWERDDRLISELAIAPQHLIDKFLEDNHPQLCTKCFQVVDRNYTCDKCSPMQCTQQLNNVHCPSCESSLLTLNNGCGTCGSIPENFLEESKEGVGLKQSSKRRQCKGCLYKYIENKKLKSGVIASYPRVIGHREPSNPHHWRWGFNWEEKIDKEWKGRSFGCVPVGAIALIQSMQNEGVSLEKIIDFIKRAKSKKS